MLDLSHQQMEQYQEQPAHTQKIAYQQRLLQEDLVSIRAQISRLSTVSQHECVCMKVCIRMQQECVVYVRVCV